MEDEGGYSEVGQSVGVCGGIEEEREGEEVGRGGEEAVQREGEVEGGTTYPAPWSTPEEITRFHYE